MSPIESVSSVAILRRMRRIILPERVLGKPGAQWMTSGVAIGPIAVRTCCLRLVFERVSVLFAGVERHVGVNALALDVVWKTNDPQPSATLVCSTNALSTSAVPMRWPETLITSSTRPVIQ